MATWSRMLALGAVMAVEKNVPWGRRLSAPLGLLLVAWGLVLVASAHRSQEGAEVSIVTEQELITQAALDYFEGWFEGDAARMERALHPELAKRPGRVDHSVAGNLGTLTARRPRSSHRRRSGRRLGRHCHRDRSFRRLPRVLAPRADCGRLEDLECAVEVDAGPRAVHVTEPAQQTTARVAAEEALLDAAERLLVEVGHAGITTRKLAETAGVNHGLVHYYFGSNENLLVRALERFTEGLVARQRELYAADMPFIEKWRTAMRYLVSEDVTYEKIWMELQAFAWNNADLRARLERVNAEWRAVLTDAFEEPHRELGIDMPLDALVSLVLTFNIGIMVERLGGIETGHAELLDWIDAWLSR
jgi:AcrR family transcriptional regulator